LDRSAAEARRARKRNTKVTSASAAEGRYGETTPKLASLQPSEGGKVTKI
jgi:hypothetical protein